MRNERHDKHAGTIRRLSAPDVNSDSTTLARLRTVSPISLAWGRGRVDRIVSDIFGYHALRSIGLRRPTFAPAAFPCVSAGTLDGADFLVTTRPCPSPPTASIWSSCRMFSNSGDELHQILREVEPS